MFVRPSLPVFNSRPPRDCFPFRFTVCNTTAAFLTGLPSESRTTKNRKFELGPSSSWARVNPTRPNPSASPNAHASKRLFHSRPILAGCETNSVSDGFGEGHEFTRAVKSLKICPRLSA